MARMQVAVEQISEPKHADVPMQAHVKPGGKHPWGQRPFDLQVLFAFRI